VFGVDNWRRLVPLGVAALAIGTGIGGAATAVSGVAGASVIGTPCTLTAAFPTPLAPDHPSVPVTGTHHGHAAGSGNLVVDIPPSVFIRAHGSRLVITTNTGRPPTLGDTFFYIARGEAVIADRRVRRQVVSGCAVDFSHTSAS
jgi:hypothetical protein